MNVVRENLENLTIRLGATVTADDYTAPVEKQLKEYRRKANVPGFRPGMVPMGIINKMYRKGAIADAVYRLATDACLDYVKENAIETIGEMMPSEAQKPIDFDNDTQFELVFEIGQAPAVELGLSKNESVTKYVIAPTEEMREGFRSNYMRRFGRLVDVDVVVKEEAVSGSLVQGDTTIDEAYVGLISMNDEERAPFIGKKVGDVMQVNVNELYKTPSQRASILGVKEAELDQITDPIYTFTITQIRQFANPDLNEEFFKMAFPEGDVTTEEQFNAKIEAQIRAELDKEADFKFVMDVRNYLVEKAALAMPEEFLKNWLFAVNEGKFTMEDIEKEFPAFLDMMRWDLIKRHIATEHKIEITPEEVNAEAKALAMMQFQYYGMHTVADDMLENYAQSILSNKEEARKIYDKVGERKLVAVVEEQVTVKPQDISSEEFQKLVA